MINISDRLTKKLTLIVHAGAHVGQEVEEYTRICSGKIVWLEADPDTYKELIENVKRFEEKRRSNVSHLFVNCILSDADGKPLEFKIYNNSGQSSSVLPPGKMMAQAWPGLGVSSRVESKASVTLETALGSLSLVESDFDYSLLVLDVQGYEFQVLNGLQNKTLQKFQFLVTEVSKEEVYQGQNLFIEIDNFLGLNGYRRCASFREVPWHGDILYENDKRLSQLRPFFKQSFQGLGYAKNFPKFLPEESIESRFLTACYKYFDLSTAQLFQDVLALVVSRSIRGGTFIEFGACDGITLSNTFMLEKSFDWTGLLVEPGRSWKEDLKRNRRCKVDFRCIYESSGTTVSFSESVEGELSTITEYVDSDHHAAKRSSSVEYDVETVTLNDVWGEYGMPSHIDYLSIDTEGSEFKILKTWDAGKYSASLISVEHNWTENRLKVYELLTSLGYTRVMSDISGFDDWYVHHSLSDGVIHL